MVLTQRIMSTPGPSAIVVCAHPVLLTGLSHSASAVADRYLWLYDQATTPRPGFDVPVLVRRVISNAAPEGRWTFPWPGMQFTRGLSMSLNRTLSDPSATAGTAHILANEMAFTFCYQSSQEDVALPQGLLAKRCTLTYGTSPGNPNKTCVHAGPCRLHGWTRAIIGSQFGDNSENMKFYDTLAMPLAPQTYSTKLLQMNRSNNDAMDKYTTLERGGVPFVNGMWVAWMTEPYDWSKTGIWKTFGFSDVTIYYSKGL